MRSSISEVISELNIAFREEFKTVLERKIEEAISEFRMDLPNRIARAASLIETQLVKRSEDYGLEVRFVIYDLEALKERIK